MPLADNQFLDRLPATLARSHAAQRAGGDDVATLFRARLKWLRPEDRILVEMVTLQRISIRQMGRLTGKDPGSLTRRLQRLGAALHDPLVRAVTDERCPLAIEHRQLMIEHLLQFRRVGELADLHRMNATTIRTMLAYARGWFNGYQTDKVRSTGGARKWE